MSNDEIKEKDVETAATAAISTVTIILIIAGIWMLLGFIAFILSLTCFGKTGTTTDKVLGLIIALLFGPFYFIYYAVNKSYCNNPLLTPFTKKHKMLSK